MRVPGYLDGYAYGMTMDQAWVVSWMDAPPGWARVLHPDQPDHLTLTIRMARTKDGMAAEALLIERHDGRAISARDLRSVRIPPAWVLASSLQFVPAGDDSPLIAEARGGARGKSDDHWRAVHRLWIEAQRADPRAPVRYMRQRWRPEVSDPTMRRWIKKAHERAEVSGWSDGADPSSPGTRSPGRPRPGQDQEGQDHQ